MAVAPISRLARALALPLGVAVVAVLSAPLAFYAFFSSFQEHDDEGYLLISLREYARGGVLYDEVYSQYGPAYFQLVVSLFHVARFAFVHTHGRALALALLVATAVVCAVATWRLSRSLLIALAAELLTVQVLFPSRDEPLHPGALLGLLLAGLVLAATFLDGPRWRLAAGAAGVLLASMLLVKINVGVFAALAVAAALVAASPPGRLATGLRGAVGATMAAVPLALLGPRWGEPSIRAYLAVALASVLGVAAVALTDAPGRASVGGRVRVLVATGALAIVASVGWELARGTTLASLLGGVLLGPLRHLEVAFFEPELGPGAFVAAAAGLAPAFGLVWARRRGLTERLAGSAAVGLGQLVAGLVLWLAVANRLPLSPLALTPPLLWVALARPGADRGALGLLVLAAVAALQTLHAYPIAGTQVVWATFLSIPVGGVALAEGWRRARATLAEADVLDQARGRVAGAALSAGLVTVTVSGAYATHRQLETMYALGVPFGLPGAEEIRVPAEQAALYRLLVQTLSARCRTFVTQPGLNSLYLFTGMEPPTRFNTTVWMLLLSEDQQEQIVDRLARSPSPVCALRRQRRVFTTPLARYIEERFVTVFRVEFFEFRVRREPGELAPA